MNKYSLSFYVHVLSCTCIIDLQSDHVNSVVTCMYSLMMFLNAKALLNKESYNTLQHNYNNSLIIIYNHIYSMYTINNLHFRFIIIIIIILYIQSC